MWKTRLLSFLMVVSLFYLLTPEAWAYQYHRVKKGETLYHIAKTHGTSVTSLKKANHLSGTLIRTGKILIMPGLSRRSEEPRNWETKEIAVPEKNEDVLRDPPTVPVDEIQDSSQEAGTEMQGTIEGENGENPFRAFTQRFLGIPYRFGGESLKGIDCSAFVQRVFRHFNVDLPRTARQQFKAGIKVSKNELHIGDLIFFHTYAKYPSHVGIYIGEGKMIHASSRYRQVSISDWDHPYYKKRFIGVIRIPEIENALSAPILFSSLDP